MAFPFPLETVACVGYPDVEELTAAGTVQDFHPIPFSFPPEFLRVENHDVSKVEIKR
jgi:hypothetical protein